jgi:hypothetical protein
MVKQVMKIRLLHFILLAIVIMLSCDENFVIVKCEDCLDSEPLDAKISCEFENYGVYTINLTIFEGNVEDNIIFGSYVNPANQIDYYLPVNKRYTFKAEYTDRNGIKYIAVNSVFPRVKLELEQCSTSPCYYVYDNKINMHLKYH